MTARIIDGTKAASDVMALVRQSLAGLKAQKKQLPGLAVVLVDGPKARTGIAELKKRMCRSAGLSCEVHTLGSHSSQSDVAACLRKLNKDPKVAGINIHPLPSRMDYDELVKVLDPRKDVEGIHPQNAGNLLIGDRKVIPFTARGILKLIESTGTEIAGSRAVIVGRSQHVGVPAGILLLEKSATVTFAHSRSWNLEKLVKEADILVVAAGQPEMITGSMIKPGAVVIDVGSNLVGQRLVGDVEYESVSEVAGYITPVPGGVGPVTVAMLLLNLAERSENNASA